MILLHVGLAKTGTTAFQNALTWHKDALRACDVVVPFVDDHEAHTVAARLLTGEIARRADVAGLTRLPLSDWSSQLDPNKCCIVSSEYFAHCDAATLWGYFSTFDPDVRIAFLARSQANLLLSGYFQDVAYRSVGQAIKHHRMIPDLDHALRYRTYVSIFGADNVICEWHENLRAVRQSLLSFVLERLGIADRLGDDVLNDVLLANPSLSDEVVDLLRYCNEAGLARCKALLMDGTLMFPAQFAAYRQAVAGALVAHYVQSNVAFSSAADVCCPDEARAPVEATAQRNLTWPPRLDGHENIYVMLRTMEAHLAATSVEVARTPE